MPIGGGGGDAPPKRKDGRTAIVSGIGPGLGRSIALALAREGADVALAARRERSLRSVAAEIEALGRRTVWEPTDVASAADCTGLVERAIGEFGGLDIVVNSAAAFGRAEPLADGDPEGWHEAMAVSFFGAYMDRSGINGTDWADSDNGHTQAVRIEAITPGDF